MLASEFYSFIIEEEKKRFNIQNESLRAAAQSVSAYQLKKSIGIKKTVSLNYNLSPNRCAYLYKYATLNTALVTKYFRKMAFSKEMKNTWYFKKTIKVCCFGGGPGIDVYGVFRALAVNLNLDGKITEVAVLDKCGRWDNMFNNVMSGLVDGKAKDVPATFINRNNFTYKLTQVDLLDSLPPNVIEIISSADIVCLNRFVSDILGDGRSSNALKVLGSFMKLGALVLCIDTFNEEVFQLSEDISKDNGFETVLGPLHEDFFHPSMSEKDVYGDVPQCSAKFSIVGWCKTSIMNTIFDESYSTANNSDVKSEDFNTALLSSDSKEDKFLNESFPSMCHTYTQTESNILTSTVSSKKEDLVALMKAISNLLNITEQWKKKHSLKKCCCCRHHC